MTDAKMIRFNDAEGEYLTDEELDQLQADAHGNGTYGPTEWSLLAAARSRNELARQLSTLTRLATAVVETKGNIIAGCDYPEHSEVCTCGGKEFAPWFDALASHLAGNPAPDPRETLITEVVKAWHGVHTRRLSEALDALASLESGKGE